ncbi:hypothetical protein AC622_01050 [Bacillus sp. FJAT-27916]|nr:hypothetical protein AC622_01050 [Bacillus sp. FJAT-27916]
MVFYAAIQYPFKPLELYFHNIILHIYLKMVFNFNIISFIHEIIVTAGVKILNNTDLKFLTNHG